MKTLKIALVCGVAAMLTCCTSVTGLKNMADCKFKFHSVSDVKIGSVDLSNKQTYKSLKLTDVAELMAGYASKKLMLNMNVNMKVHNPNEQVAQLDGMDYILYIDDKQMLEGVTKDQMRIEANSDANYSLPVTLNLYDAVQDKKLQPMAEFALGLATDKADASRVKVAIKPFFTFGKDTVRFPSYITIGGDQIMPKKK
ncbi:MAG: LEA type 2 family protein [Paludibacteraceae bacterium]|nr:LEA type 2 family protein [Paludibacteraceae bacterium]